MERGHYQPLLHSVILSSRYDNPLPASYFSTSIFQFRQIAVSDQGRYICVAQNNIGTSKAVAQVLVNGKHGVIKNSEYHDVVSWMGNDLHKPPLH